MTEEQPTQAPEQPPKPPQFKVARGLYWITGGVVALSIFVTMFVRNPYEQAVSMDYYDRHSYDENYVWFIVLVVVPMMGLAAFIAWRRRQNG
jgi:hypothetical protein